MDFDFALLDEEIQNAPKVGYGPRVTFGKMTYDSVNVVTPSFKKGEAPKTRPLGNVPADGEKKEYIQIVVAVDIQELNPALTFDFKRRIDVKNNSADGKELTDWQHTTLPSFVSVLGAEWSKKIKKGVYVAIEEVDTVEIDKKTGRLRGYFKKNRETGEITDQWITNTALKVIQVFKNKAECLAARDERFKKQEAVENEGSIPGTVVNDVRGMFSAGVDEDQIRTIVESTEPYNEYDAEELISAAKKPPF